MTLPNFYRAEHAALWHYRPQMDLLHRQASQQRQLIPAAELDDYRVELLVIDHQRDFCLPEGPLFVSGRSRRGSIDDAVRLVEFIYRQLGRLTRITATLDTHLDSHIFSANFWQDEQGQRPAYFTEITSDDFRQGRYLLDKAVCQLVPEHVKTDPYSWAQRQTEHYLTQLEQGGRHRLTIWPYHTLLGSDGQALTGVVHEAILFHGACRAVYNPLEIKGLNVWSEQYSVFGAEVLTWWDDTLPLTKNRPLLDRLLSSDAVIIAGQASSHCLLQSVQDLLGEHQATKSRCSIYLLKDCTSPIVIWSDDGQPLVDFTPMSEVALQRLAEQGVHLVASTDDMASWPGMETANLKPSALAEQ